MMNYRIRWVKRPYPSRHKGGWPLPVIPDVGRLDRNTSVRVPSGWVHARAERMAMTEDHPKLVATKSGAYPQALASGEWVPSKKQRLLLQIDLDPWDPPETTEARANRAGVTVRTLHNWQRDPDFREWYNRAYLAGCHVFASTAIAEMMRLIRDPGAQDSAKAKVCADLLDRFDRHGQKVEKEAALQALLGLLRPAAMKGQRVEFAMREDPSRPGGVAVAASINGEPGGQDQAECNIIDVIGSKDSQSEPEQQGEGEGGWLPPELLKPPPNPAPAPAPLVDVPQVVDPGGEGG